MGTDQQSHVYNFGQLSKKSFPIPAMSPSIEKTKSTQVLMWDLGQRTSKNVKILKVPQVTGNWRDRVINTIITWSLRVLPEEQIPGVRILLSTQKKTNKKTLIENVLGKGLTSRLQASSPLWCTESWQPTPSDEAEAVLEQWCQSADRSRPDGMDEVLGSIRSNQPR